MYHIVDLLSKTQDTVHFESKLSLLFWWKQKNTSRLWWNTPLHFDELNVTGVDMHMVMVPSSDNMFGFTYSEQKKRYQVFDDFGRSIDIRGWTPEIKAVNDGWHPVYIYSEQYRGRFRKDPSGYGKKRHAHRVGCASMWRASMVQVSLDHDDELDGCYPIVDKAKFRDRGFTSGNGWRNYDKRIWKRYTRSTCWKDQFKAGHQWSKHKKGVDKKFLRNEEKKMDTIDAAFEDIVFSVNNGTSYCESDEEIRDESLYLDYLFCSGF